MVITRAERPEEDSTQLSHEPKQRDGGSLDAAKGGSRLSTELCWAPVYEVDPTSPSHLERDRQREWFLISSSVVDLADLEPVTFLFDDRPDDKLREIRPPDGRAD